MAKQTCRTNKDWRSLPAGAILKVNTGGGDISPKGSCELSPVFYERLKMAKNKYTITPEYPDSTSYMLWENGMGIALFYSDDATKLNGKENAKKFLKILKSEAKNERH